MEHFNKLLKLSSKYMQTFNISGTLVSDKIVYHSADVEASPVNAVPTSFSLFS